MRGKVKISMEQIKEMIVLHNEQLGANEIGRRLNICSDTVRYHLIKLGITPNKVCRKGMIKKNAPKTGRFAHLK